MTEGPIMRTLLGAIISTLLLVAAVAGCSSAADEPNVEQTEWILRSFDGKEASAMGFEGVMPHITLADGKVTGNLTVNRVNGNYELSGDDISFSQLARTKMVGPPEAMEQEEQFLTALERAARVEVQDSMMVLLDSGDVVVAQLMAPVEG